MQHDRTPQRWAVEGLKTCEFEFQSWVFQDKLLLISELRELNGQVWTKKGIFSVKIDFEQLATSNHSMNLAQILNIEPLRNSDIEKRRLIHFSRITSK
jgi:hypothetical protein